MTLNVLLDEGSFSEIGVNAGFGTIDGRPICVYHLKGKVCRCSTEIVELALKTGTPILTVLECDGMEVSFEALSSVAKLSSSLALASGVVPRISVVAGKIHGVLCYPLGDFVVAIKGGEMSLVPPDVIKLVTGKDAQVDLESHYGGENVHLLAESEEEAAELVKRLISFLPLNNMDDPPIAETSDDPARKCERIKIPEDPYAPYDVREVIADIVDDGDFMEIQPKFAPSVVVGFGRLDGTSVGVVANDPMHDMGCLNFDAVRKVARFVRFCDAFNIPIVNLVDTPGFMPDNDQELRGLAYNSTKLLQTYSGVTVPMITVVLRKAYGSAYVSMGSKFAGADVVYAYPNAEFAVMDVDTDVRTIYGELGEEERRRKVEEYRKTEASAERALERGFVDAIIEPEWTRSRIINALRMLETKRRRLPPKKHDT